jgi:5'-3' exoribonuclease 2
LEGLEFYCTYYYLGCQSWSWFYPYHYTPLLADVYEYLHKNKINEVKLPVKGDPFDPLMALMFMMPQQSFGLLPEAIRKVLEDPTNQLRGPEDYYSNDFEMDKFSNPQDLDKKALVPFLDETMVRDVYSKIPKEAFTKEEQNRNVLHDPLFLKRDGSGKDEKTSGFEFNLKKDSSINEVIKVMNKPTTETRKRLPTLKIYGDTIKNTKTGFQIIITSKYKPKHQED